MQIWNKIQEFYFAHDKQIITFVAVLILGWIVIKVLTAIIGKTLKKTPKVSSVAGGFVTTVVKVALYLIYLIALLTLLGVPTTSLVAVLTAFSLAASLALQNSLSNFAGGLILVATKPFEEGDFVDIGGTVGIVKDITITNTHLTTGDNKVVVIPNATVSSATITNYSQNPERRVDLVFSVAYGSSIQKVKDVIMGVVETQPNILMDKGVTIRLTEHGASSLNFVTRVWVNQADYWNTYFDLNERVLEAFTENGLEVPFPQLDVHMIDNK